MGSALKQYLFAVLKHWSGLVAGLVGVILTVFSIADPAVTRVVGVLLLVGGVSVAQFKAWRDLRRDRAAAILERDQAREDLAADRAAQPIIEVGRPHVAPETASNTSFALTGGAGATGATGAIGPSVGLPLHCARLVVSNTSHSAREAATARAVRASLAFTPSGINVQGKWTAGREPVRRREGVEDLLALSALDIAPGESRNLDVAIKYESDDICYAFANDSYWSDFRIPKYLLPGTEWLVSVEVTGTGVGVVRRTFLLRMRSGELQFEDRPSDLRTER